MNSYSALQWFGATLLMGIVGCAGGELTLPTDGSPSSLRVVSGDGQEATVGSELPKPLVIRLSDRGGRPMPGVSVQFRFQSEAESGRIQPDVQETDDTGFASVRVRLGGTAGSQTVEARLADNVAGDVRAVFGLTALDRPEKKDDKKDNTDDKKGHDHDKGGGHHDDDDD